ncbi:hypothetical protein PanWU01x14_246560 [Parasponia andersonii]|uniref:Uncharacterized protein n=1 Tax=Parasponia andersonii TaxID=3476 RepID=A0A2P5BEC9_PARAD|nr:hypothetical protein PanWU01x14_246560 [Parasponia andersonii]
MSRVLLDKFLPYTSLRDAYIGPTPSVIWRSIIWGLSALNHGIRWQIGNDNSVQVFKDQWLP